MRRNDTFTEKRREQVSLQMVYGEKRPSGPKRETLGSRSSDEESRGEPGSGCRRKGINLRVRQSCFGEGASNKLRNKGEVISRSNLRNYPSILRVNASLRRDSMREHISAAA
jgi:hypothetical protein